MAINDPIADMLTRIRNAVMSGQTLVAMPSSKIKVEIAKIMKDEGYLKGFEMIEGETQPQESNVNSIGEMVKMIEGMRSYESAQKLIQTLDRMAEVAIQDIGRVA